MQTSGTPRSPLHYVIVIISLYKINSSRLISALEIHICAGLLILMLPNMIMVLLWLHFSPHSPSLHPTPCVSPRAEITCCFVQGINNVFNGAGLSCLSLFLSLWLSHSPSPISPGDEFSLLGENWNKGGRRIDERLRGIRDKERRLKTIERATACSQSKIGPAVCNMHNGGGVGEIVKYRDSQWALINSALPTYPQSPYLYSRHMQLTKQGKYCKPRQACRPDEVKVQSS